MDDNLEGLNRSVGSLKPAPQKLARAHSAVMSDIRDGLAIYPRADFNASYEGNVVYVKDLMDGSYVIMVYVILVGDSGRDVTV